MSDAPTPEALLAAARAVAAADRAHWISEANDRHRETTIAEAAGHDVPFAVPVRRSVLVADLDGSATANAELAARLVAAAERCGVPIVVARSGGPGRIHLYLVVGSAHCVDRAALIWRLRQLGADMRSVVRPLLARHRTSGRSIPVASPQRNEVLDTGEAVARLTSTPAPAAARRLARELGVPPLADSMRRLAERGHEHTRWPSASEGRAAVAVAAASVGIDRGFMSVLLHDPFCPLGDTFRARPTPWRRDEVARLEALGTLNLVGNDARRRTDDWLARLRSARWPGKAGASNLAVGEAVAALARRAGTDTPAASVRSVGVKAGVHVHTARMALARLIDAGWLEVATEGTATKATVWRLTLPPEAPAITSSGYRDSADEELFATDASRWGALGKSKMRVWRELGDDPVSSSDIAARISSTPRAVGAHLTDLRRAGMAGWTGSGWIRTATTLGEAAVSKGMWGAGERDESAYRARMRTRRDHPTPLGARSAPPTVRTGT